MISLKELSTKILVDIDEYAITTYDNGHRDHLGASIIGKECGREIWSIWRWLKKPMFSGRMQRLFQRGHLEEHRFIEYLRGVGFTVWDRDENGDQIRINDCHGHFGGSLDGQVLFPTSYVEELQSLGLDPSKQFLAEFKTKGTGSAFVKLKEKGVMITNMEHWAQQCVYGHKKELTHGIYMSVNKNDDDLHIEAVKLDTSLGADMIRKAERIIVSQKPPEKISESSTYFKCKICTFEGICHHGETVEKNCRSCLHATPVENAEWHCQKWNAVIPKEAIRAGCDAHLGIV